MLYPILDGTRLDWPTDWDTLFGRSAPLLVEVGFGTADYFVHLARTHQDKNVLGAEISLPSLRKGQKKLHGAGLDNGRIIHTQAQYLFQALLTPQSISHLYINFPDPWPKAGHNHRRLINADFLQLVASRLHEGATLDIATDHADYIDVVTEVMSQTPHFDSRLPTLFTIDASARIGSKYEQKALDEGRTPHYYKFRRNATAVTHPPIPKETPMPHMVIQSPLSLAEINQKFTPQNRTIDTLSLRLIESFYAAREDKVLIETFINEQPLDQRIGFTIRRQNNGSYVIGLHEIGFPRPTAGTHHAVKLIADWVVSLHPDTQIVHTSLQAEAM